MPITPNGSYAVGPGASVTDAQGNFYVIDADGQIVINGIVDATTAQVDVLGFENGLVWQENAENLWYSKASATTPWVDLPPSSAVPLTPTFVSPNNSSGTIIDDANLNVWSINADGQIVIDGMVDETTRNVIKLEYVNGRIWQENAFGDFFSKLTPADAWTAATAIDPLDPTSTAQVWSGGIHHNDPTKGANWSQGNRPVPNETLTMVTGTMNLGGGNLAGNPLIIDDQSSAAPAPIINMTNGGSLELTIPRSTSDTVQVNVTHGKATLDLSSPYPSDLSAIVTADKLSTVLLSSQMTFGHLTETGGTVRLNGTNQFSGSTVVLNSRISGTGTIGLGSAQSVSGHLEVNGAIGAGVTIAVTGDPDRHVTSSVVLDMAGADKGLVTLRDSFLEIKATDIDSLLYQNGTLSLYHGNTVMSAVKVVGIAETFPGAVNDGTLSFGKDASGNIYASTGAHNLPSLTPVPTHV